jgi:uncharacterized glyoxalase superfamily protein PhnB
MAVRINAIGLVAEDFRATLAFYERLGCTFRDATEPHAEADLGGVRLMVDTAASVAEFGEGEIGPRHGVALAAQLESPAEVDALYAELDAAGRGALKPFDAPWGMRYATVTDPDGTSVDLYAWLPGQQPPA